jgi:hypothetical protein
LHTSINMYKGPNNAAKESTQDVSYDRRLCLTMLLRKESEEVLTIVKEKIR